LENKPKFQDWGFHFLTLLLCFAVYYFLRLPFATLGNLFLDDGETLYHLFSVIRGRIPYLEDYHHHFMGYLLPYLALSKIQGFSPDLIREMSFINQTLMGLGVYFCLRFFTSPVRALIGALLAISAREPFVIGFFVHYQNNLLSVFIWFFCLRFLKTKSDFNLCIGAFISGILFTYDQRCMLHVLLPWLALFLENGLKIKLMQIVKLIAFAAIAPGLLVFYLLKNQAWGVFLEQCFIFPRDYRIASQSWTEAIRSAISAHDFLFTQTPILLISGMIGLLCLVLAIKNQEKSKMCTFLLFAGVIQIATSSLGGRYYDYYTIPWLPWLAILAVIGLERIGSSSKLLEGGYSLFIISPIFLALGNAARVNVDDLTARAHADGSDKVVSYLKENLSESDTVLVWGYRLGLYVRINKLSAYPFANLLMIHPDQQVVGREEREKHIYPAYEAEFEKYLENEPPNIIIVPWRNKVRLESKVQDLVDAKLSSSYKKVFESSGSNLIGEVTHFDVYRRAS